MYMYVYIYIYIHEHVTGLLGRITPNGYLHIICMCVYTYMCIHIYVCIYM